MEGRASLLAMTKRDGSAITVITVGVIGGPEAYLGSVATGATGDHFLLIQTHYEKKLK